MNFKELNSFIIAELSANHNGSIQTAVETIRAAKRAGANAIKLQTYRADTITLDSHQKISLLMIIPFGGKILRFI